MSTFVRPANWSKRTHCKCALCQMKYSNKTDEPAVLHALWVTFVMPHWTQEERLRLLSCATFLQPQ